MIPAVPAIYVYIWYTQVYSYIYIRFNDWLQIKKANQNVRHEHEYGDEWGKKCSALFGARVMWPKEPFFLFLIVVWFRFHSICFNFAWLIRSWYGCWDIFFWDITRYRSTHMHPLGQIWRRKCGCRMVFICKIFLVLLSQHIIRLSNSCCLLGLVGLWYLVFRFWGVQDNGLDRLWEA